MGAATFLLLLLLLLWLKSIATELLLLERSADCHHNATEGLRTNASPPRVFGLFLCRRRERSSSSPNDVARRVVAHARSLAVSLSLISLFRSLSLALARSRSRSLSLARSRSLSLSLARSRSLSLALALSGSSHKGAMALEFHPNHPSLLAVGCYDGNVMIFDVSKKGGGGGNKQGSFGPIYASSAVTGKHADPVWQARRRPRNNHPHRRRRCLERGRVVWSVGRSVGWAGLSWSVGWFGRVDWLVGWLVGWLAA